ncbi:MAG: extracellular solute-binding protein [Magnetospirillum sp. WYHS-4]
MRLFPALLAVLVAAPALAADPAPRHGLAMHGEPKYQAGFAHFDYVDPAAPKGGSVRLGSVGSFDDLNGFIVKGDAADGLGQIYDSLLVSSADEAFTEYGLLAESVEVPEDRSWVVFNLRKEARWHDGRPVTADDVIFTFATLMEKGQPHYRLYYAGVARTEKLGPHKVKFSFKPGENRELPLILGQIEILPKHWWEGRDFSRTTLEPPLGSGPYRIKSVDAGRSVAYERVADYWGKDLPVNKGSHNFDTIRYDYYRDGTVALEAFKAGEFDYRAENSSKDWATGYDVPAVKKGWIKKSEIKHDRPAGMQGFVYNLRRDLFKDRRVREALAYAFDFEWSNKNLFHGQYRRSRSYFDNSELAATGLPSPDEMSILEKFRGRVPDEVFAKAYAPPGTDGSGQIRTNLKEADRLLKEAGWTIKDGVRANAAGKPFEFEILLVSPLFERIALPFVGNLERLGVKARVRTIDSAQYVRRAETFDYDMVVMTWGQSESPGNEQRNYWTAAAADQPGSRNFPGIKDPVVDELVDRLIAAPDRQSLVTRTRALDRVLQWGFYVIPHWHLDYDRMAYWDKFGMPKVTPRRGAQFTTWWIDPAKEKSLEERRKSGQ